MIILRNAKLVPFLSGGLDAGDVIVRDSRIEALLPPGAAQAHEGDAVVDLTGCTLIPGMFDLHMHMYFVTDDFVDLGARGHNQHFVDSIRYLKQYLARGYTTVRDCGNPGFIGVAIRDAIRAGVLTGPRVFACGTCVTPTAKGNDTFPTLYTEVDDPARIMGVCRREAAQGVDFLKYMATGSVANVTGEPGQCITTREELFAMQQAAESLGLPLAVHCHGTTGIEYCVEAGVRSIEHASFMTPNCIESILRRGGRTALVPTLSPVCELYEDAEGTVPAYLKAKIPSMWAATGNLVEASRAGVLVGWGTDSSMKFSAAHPGYEFYARQKVGFTAEEMLRQATLDSARVLGLENELGTLEPGKLADAVALDGDPLADIVAAMRKPPRLVMKEGAIV